MESISRSKAAQGREGKAKSSCKSKRKINDNQSISCYHGPIKIRQYFSPFCFSSTMEFNISISICWFKFHIVRFPFYALHICVSIPMVPFFPTTFTPINQSIAFNVWWTLTYVGVNFKNKALIFFSKLFFTVYRISIFTA